MTSIGPRASGRGDRDERIQVVIDETEVVRRHSGEVGWPTVALCAGLVAAYVGVIVGWFAGLVPLWAGFALNAVLTYAFYTVHHDANHKGDCRA